MARDPAQPMPAAQRRAAGSTARAARDRAHIFPARAMPGWAGVERHQHCRHHLLHAVYHYPLFTHLQPSFHPSARRPASSHPCLPRGEPGAKGPSSPGACEEWARRGGAAATSPFLRDRALPGPITIDKPAAIVWAEQGEIPQVPQGAQGQPGDIPATAGASLSVHQVTNRWR